MTNMDSMTIKITSFTGSPKGSLRELIRGVAKIHKSLVKNFQLLMPYPDVCSFLIKFLFK